MKLKPIQKINNDLSIEDEIFKMQVSGSRNSKLFAEKTAPIYSKLSYNLKQNKGHNIFTLKSLRN